MPVERSEREMAPIRNEDKVSQNFFLKGVEEKKNNFN
jgi:hypothetical protein